MRACRCEAPLVGDDDECAKCGHVVVRAEPQLTPAQRIVVLTIQAFHRRHGRIPRQTEWARCDGTYPSAAQVKRIFGTWKAAIVAAGFTPPAQGRKPKASGAANGEPTPPDHLARFAASL